MVFGIICMIFGIVLGLSIAGMVIFATLFRNHDACKPMKAEDVIKLASQLPLNHWGVVCVTDTVDSYTHQVIVESTVLGIDVIAGGYVTHGTLSDVFEIEVKHDR